MTEKEIKDGAPMFANAYYVDGENVLYFDNDQIVDELFIFIPSLGEFLIICNFPLDKLKPL